MTDEAPTATSPAAVPPPDVHRISLLDAMVEGREYQSIVDLQGHIDVVGELRRGLGEIATARGRVCLAYVGNVTSTAGSASAIGPDDDLPFAEMITSVKPEVRKIDVLLSTTGGSGQQVGRFVDALRARFDEVDFLIPSFCMSAGTMFALSGDNIWMSERACLGPIDPQVPTVGGRFVPAQALLLLVEKLQKDGQEAIKREGTVPWTAVRIVDTIDKKELGEAITASDYSRKMVQEFLVKYKFRNWTKRATSGESVTPEYKVVRATEIADALCSHERWKNHGHAINRDVLWSEIKLRIEHPKDAMLRAMTRTWAALAFIFDKTPMQKLIVSPDYAFLRFNPQQLQIAPSP